MKHTIAKFFLFLAAVQLAMAQPTIPVSNLYPVTANTLVGGGSTTGRGTIITAGTGISIQNGVISSMGGAGDAPAGATYILKTANATLTNAQVLSSLSSGVVTVTTGTGVLASIAPGASGNIITSNGTGWASTIPAYNGNVTAAGTLDSGNIVIGQGGKSIATSSVFSISGSNATVTGNLAITGSTTFNNLTTSNLTVTGNFVGNLAATQVTIADAGGYYSGTNVESALQEVGGNIVALQSSVGPSPSGNQLISGGGVALAPGGGLNVTASAASYLIQGTTYNSAMTNLTLSAADPSNPRIDVIAVNSSGNAVVITGTPAATPSKPDVDPSTQLELTFFLVGAAATNLDVDVTDVYLNNAEWTTTASGGTINVASTNNPYTGSLCIEGTSVTTGDYVQFVKPASGTFNIGDYDNLVFYIRSKASWPNPKLITITVRDGTGQLGSAITFDQGLFGFNSGQTSTYQQIIIPTGLFAASGLSTATTIRMAVAGSGGTIGFYIDDVTLQGGISTTTDSSRMKWRGNYVASSFYNVNDVVLSSGIQYVAIQAGVGNTPASSPTFWQASSTSTGGTVTVSGTPTAGQLAQWTTATNVIGVTSANVTQGGTGLSTLTANNIIIGNGTGSVTFVAPGTSGNIVTSNGTAFNSTAPAWFGNALVSGCTTVTANSTGNITLASANANLTITTDNTTKTITFNATGGGGSGDMLSTQLSSEVSITTTTTLNSTAFGKWHVCSGTSSDYTVTLPATSGNEGKFIGFRMDVAANLTKLITLDGSGGELIDGSFTRIMWVDEVAVIKVTNGNWTKVAGKSIPMRAYGERTSATSVPNNSATQVVINSSLIDRGGLLNTSTGNITARRPGLYVISGMVSMELAGVSPGFEAYCIIYKNGSLASGPAMLTVVPTNTNGSNTLAHVAYSTTRELAESDYVSLVAQQATGSTMTTRTTDVVRPYLSVLEVPSW